MAPPIKITHSRQQKPYSCGAAAFGMLFGLTENQAGKLVKTSSEGTDTNDVIGCLKNKGIPHEMIPLGKPFQAVIPDLITVSRKFPIYASGLFKDKFFTKGRCRERRHSFLLSDGLIYDPAEKREMSWEAYQSVFNKSLCINNIIIIDIERPNFLKNTED